MPAYEDGNGATLSFSAKAEVDEWLIEQAQQRGESKSEIMRQAIRAQMDTDTGRHDEHVPMQDTEESVYRAAVKISQPDHILGEEEFGRVASETRVSAENVGYVMRDLEEKHFATHFSRNINLEDTRMFYHVKPLTAVPGEWIRNREKLDEAQKRRAEARTQRLMKQQNTDGKTWPPKVRADIQRLFPDGHVPDYDEIGRSA